MSNDQITALAREYAEEMIKGKPSEELPNCLKNSMLAMNTEYIAEIFQWLTRRFYLVEKEAVRKEYEPVKDTPDDCGYEEYGASWDEIPYLNGFYAEGYDCGKKNLLESLFPEIAKEAEE